MWTQRRQLVFNMSHHQLLYTDIADEMCFQVKCYVLFNKWQATVSNDETTRYRFVSSFRSEA